MNNNVTEKSLREYISLRKSIYIGNCNTFKTDMWIIEEDELVKKEIYYNEGYFKLIDEILSNSIDEFIKTQGKFANNIDVFIDNDLTITIKDNGRGIPCKQTDNGKYQIELAFTKIHAGSNWERESQHGMNGIGASAVNFLSSRFDVISMDVKFIQNLSCNNRCENHNILITKNKTKTTGTSVIFKIDNTQFDEINFIDYQMVENIIYKRLIELKTVMKNINFTLNCLPINRNIIDYLNFEGILYNKNDIHIGMYYMQNNDQDMSYINGLNTYRGGSHIKYVKNEILNYLKDKINKKYKILLKTSQLASCFTFFLSFNNYKNAEFDNQNKTKLETKESDIKKYLEQQEFDIDFYCKRFYEQFESKFQDIVDIFSHKEIQAKIKSKKDDVKNVKHITTFTDAVDKDRRDTILFLVEGESAKSHFQIVRNKMKHGIFQLKGKVLNSYEKTLSKVLENKELINLMNIMNINIGKKPNNTYFDKIGILTDADVDGHHIKTLLLVFFYKYFPQLIEEGKIIIVLSPIIIAKKGKKVDRFYDYNEFLKVQDKYDTVKYNKGLGSLSKEEYSYMLNNLQYYQVNIEDAKNANRVLHNLFNDKKTDIRKKWLSGQSMQEIIKNDLEKNEKSDIIETEQDILTELLTGK
jgi:DNA topoisomerase-2